MGWEKAIERLGGAASTRQLRAAGAAPSTLTQTVRNGALVRVRPGVYAVPGFDGQRLAAARAGGRLSCVSAARTYGLWAGYDRRIHVRLRPNANGTRPAGPVYHWVVAEPHPEIWRVSLRDCLRSVARCADDETAVAVFDTALAKGLVSPIGLRAILSTESARVRAIAGLARPGSDSGVESIVRQRLEARGHLVEQQLHVPGVGRVDMRVDGVVLLEIDSFAYHGSPEEFEQDRRRDAHLAIRTRERLRITARQVADDWEEVLASIHAMLRRSESG